MKKIVICLFITLLINFAAAPCFSSTAIGEAMKILPESTDFILKFSSTKDLYNYFSVTDKTFWGKPIEDINEIKEMFGFNPFALKELQGNGFDTDKPFGVAVSDFKVVDGSDNPHMNIVIYLPVNDTEKAVLKIKEFVEDENPDAKFTKNGEVWSWYLDIDTSEPEDLEPEPVIDDGQSQTDNIQSEETQDQSNNAQDDNQEEHPVEPVTPPVAFYMVNKNGYLLLGTNPVVDAKHFFENIGKNGKKLVNSTVFTDVANKTDISSELFLYANLGRIFNANPQVMQFLTPVLSQIAENGNNNKNPNTNSSEYPGLNYLKDYQGIGISADLKHPDFKANFVLNILEKSEMFNLFKNITPKRDLILGFREKPLVLMAVVENLQVYWSMIQETLDKKTLNTMKQEFSRIKTDYNIDIEKDVIQNLGGNVSAGIYDAISINMANINTLAAVEFKDPSKIKGAIEKLIVKLPPQQQSMVNKIQINDNEVYMVPVGPVQLYAGFIGNDLVITLGKSMFEKAITADQGNSFITELKDKSLQKSLQQDISLLFFDVREAQYAVKNFVPMLMYANPESQIINTPEFKKIMEPLDYISAFSRIDDTSMVGEFVFKTDFNKPFLQGIKDLGEQIEELQKSMNLNQAKESESASTEDQAAKKPEGAIKE